MCLVCTDFLRVFGGRIDCNCIYAHKVRCLVSFFMLFQNELQLGGKLTASILYLIKWIKDCEASNEFEYFIPELMVCCCY